MKTWILGLVGVCSLVLLGTRAEAWQDTIHGIIDSPADSAQAVAVDAAGNVVAAGQLQNTDTVAFAVLKVEGVSGTEQWRQVLAGGSANKVAVDGNGDVVAAGRLSTSTDTAFA